MRVNFLWTTTINAYVDDLLITTVSDKAIDKLIDHLIKSNFKTYQSTLETHTHIWKLILKYWINILLSIWSSILKRCLNQGVYLRECWIQHVKKLDQVLGYLSKDPKRMLRYKRGGKVNFKVFIDASFVLHTCRSY